MGQQSNKIIKRRRRAQYLKRKKEQAKLGGLVKRPVVKKEAPAKKAPAAKKAVAKKAPAKKAAKKVAKKAADVVENTDDPGAEVVETTAQESENAAQG